MAREVAGVSAECVEYVPDIDDNRNDPDPFCVGLEPASAAELRAIERGMGEMSNGKINFMERAHKQIEALIGKRVKWVRGYTIKDRRTGSPIKPENGVGLYRAIIDHGDAHESTIIDDIVEAIKNQSHLKAGLRDRLRSQSEPPPSAATP